jgi:hypothetical protein
MENLERLNVELWLWDHCHRLKNDGFMYLHNYPPPTTVISFCLIHDTSVLSMGTTGYVAQKLNSMMISSAFFTSGLHAPNINLTLHNWHNFIPLEGVLHTTGPHPYFVANIITDLPTYCSGRVTTTPYSGGLGLQYLPEGRLSWLRLPWFTSVIPGKCRYTFLNWAIIILSRVKWL